MHALSANPSGMGNAGNTDIPWIEATGHAAEPKHSASMAFRDSPERRACFSFLEPRMDYDFSRGQYRRIYSGAVFGRRLNRVGHLAERLFWRLVASCDDYGNHGWDPYMVRHQLVPLVDVSPDDLQSAMRELESERLVVAYERAGEPFVHVAGHLELQPSSSNGRRVRRFPPSPAERDDLLADGWPPPTPTAQPEQNTENVAVNPGESGGIQKIQDNPSESKKSKIVQVCPKNPSDTTTTITTKTTTKTTNSSSSRQQPTAAAASAPREGDEPTFTPSAEPDAAVAGDLRIEDAQPKTATAASDLGVRERTHADRLVAAVDRCLHKRDEKTTAEQLAAKCGVPLEALEAVVIEARELSSMAAAVALWETAAEGWEAGSAISSDAAQKIFLNRARMLRQGPQSAADVAKNATTENRPSDAVIATGEGDEPTTPSYFPPLHDLHAVGLTPIDLDAHAGVEPSRVRDAVARMVKMSEKKPIENPPGLLRHLLEQGVAAKSNSVNERRQAAAAEVRDAVEKARLSACATLNLPRDFFPSRRHRHPAVPPMDADAVQQAMVEAAQGVKRARAARREVQP